MRNFLIMSLLSMVSFGCFAMQSYMQNKPLPRQVTYMSPHMFLMLKLDSAEYKNYCEFSEAIHTAWNAVDALPLNQKIILFSDGIPRRPTQHEIARLYIDEFVKD